MVSWTAWSGHQHHQQEAESFETVKEDKAPARNRTLELPPPVTVVTRPDPPSVDEPKRRPVSRLWPSFSSIGRDRSASRVQADPSLLLPPPAEEEHIYEEIDDIKERGRGLSRAGRGGSFAGASRQDILRYLEELRKKHPTGIISVEAERERERKRPNSPSPNSPMTPSLPQLIPADEDEDDEMGALLLAMRHNGPNRNSNRSTQSSTSTQSSSQESALSVPGITPTSSTIGYQVKNDYKKLDEGRNACHDDSHHPFFCWAVQKKKSKSGRFIFHINRSIVDDIGVGKYISVKVCACVVHVVDMIILTRHAISVWCWCHLENGEK